MEPELKLEERIIINEKSFDKQIRAIISLSDKFYEEGDHYTAAVLSACAGDEFHPYKRNTISSSCAGDEFDSGRNNKKDFPYYFNNGWPRAAFILKESHPLVAKALFKESYAMQKYLGKDFCEEATYTHKNNIRKNISDCNKYKRKKYSFESFKRYEFTTLLGKIGAASIALLCDFITEVITEATVGVGVLAERAFYRSGIQIDSLPKEERLTLPLLNEKITAKNIHLLFSSPKPRLPLELALICKIPTIRNILDDYLVPNQAKRVYLHEHEILSNWR
ncbi:MAG: hypothetical protein V1866_01215 [archaeon]